MGSSPIVKLVLEEKLFWWQSLVERVGGSLLLLGMIVIVSDSVELERPVMPVSLGDQVSFLVLRRLFCKSDPWLSYVTFVAVKYEALFCCSFHKLK